MARRKSSARPGAGSSPPSHRRRSGRRHSEWWQNRPRWQRILTVLAALGLLAAAAALVDWYRTIPDDRVATYAGSQSCIACHDAQHKLWTGSDHDLAMDLASEATVLGDFSGVELEHFDTTSRMYRGDGGRFMIHTEGPDGRPGEFEVKYVFGHDPLQSYMVEIEPLADAAPGQIGRVQVLRETWDTHEKKWFYLSPSDVNERLAHHDPLHWTGPAQNWNYACAECHSTDLQKNFHLTTRGGGTGYLGEYHTTFSEIDVACEACHGPGSIHVELAEARSLFWDRKRGYGLQPLHELSAAAEVDNCGTCHSRRHQLTDDFRPGDPYHDHYENSLITEGIYYCDGQILDEVYVYGSFTQSRMYQKGVRCTDCHDPHTTDLRHTGNALCTSCHQHQEARYDTPAHHFHRTGSSGAACIECHMPPTTYMEVDPRRDHSLRAPRPDLSVDLGTPNACSQCHLVDSPAYEARRQELPEYQDWLTAAREGDEGAAAEIARLDAWSLEHFTRWYGEKPDRGRHFAYTLAAAWRYEPAAVGPLAHLVRDGEQQSIVRASALAALGPYLSPTTDYSGEPYKSAQEALLAALNDRDPQVRATAVATLALLPPQERLEHGLRLLGDPVRTVRLQAASLFASVPTDRSDERWRERWEAVLAERHATLELDSDQPGAHIELGEFFQRADEPSMAAAEYHTAIALAPYAAGSRSQLALLLESLAQRQQRFPEQSAALSVEAKRLREEDLSLLARAAEELPQSAQVQLSYGLALYLADDEPAAEQAFQRAIELEPNWPDPILMLASLYDEQGRWSEAVQLAARLVELRPQETNYPHLLEAYRQRASSEESEVSGNGGE